MFDSSSEAFHRAGKDPNYPRRQSEATPFSHFYNSGQMRVGDERNSFGGYQPQLQQKKIFGFQIFVDNDIIKEMGSTEEWFASIAKAGNIESVKFNLDLNIPDLNGRNIQIFDKEIEHKYLSCKAMLADVYQAFKKIKRQPFSIIIFVPEGMVSLLIGTRGYQINKIMRESHTTIVVNQPINKMVYRTVKIQGYHSDIARACKIIYDILQEKSSIAYSIEKEPSQLDYTKARVKTKFIFTNTIVNFLQYKKKTFMKRVEEDTKCVLKFNEDTSSRLLRKDEELCVVLGKLEDVQAMLVMVINLIQNYFDEDKKNYDYTFKMLIPSNYVTKLIGQKGYMIRDIIERSGGAQIKIMSDKQSERDARECIISINGSRQNKIDAACLILEQIQCFKNGGPILQSGKSINENLAQQFKNSIPLRQNQFEEEIFEKKQPMLKDETINKFLKNIPRGLNDFENKEQQGLIEVEAEPNIISGLTPTNEETQRYKNIEKSRHSSSQASHQKASKSKSRSSSRQLRQDKQILEIKLVVPRRLGGDQKQLRYIERISGCQIITKEQRIEGSSQMIIGVRGSMKNNSHCLKLLQKRIIRMASQSSYVR